MTTNRCKFLSLFFKKYILVIKLALLGTIIYSSAVICDDATAAEVINEKEQTSIIDPIISSEKQITEQIAEGAANLVAKASEAVSNEASLNEKWVVQALSFKDLVKEKIQEAKQRAIEIKQDAKETIIDAKNEVKDKIKEGQQVVENIQNSGIIQNITNAAESTWNNLNSSDQSLINGTYFLPFNIIEFFQIDKVEQAKKTASDIWSSVSQNAHKLQFTLDLDNDSIEFQSEEKNVNGDPQYQFTIQKDGTIVSKDQPEAPPQTQEVVAEVPQSETIKETPATVENQVTSTSTEEVQPPVQEQILPIETQAPTPQEEKPIQENAAPVETENVEKQPEVIATPQTQDAIPPSQMSAEQESAEQADMAFKVLFVFLSFIVVCFGLLYVYFRLQQASQGNSTSQKPQQKFYDFVQGNIEDDFPMVQQNNQGRF